MCLWTDESAIGSQFAEMMTFLRLSTQPPLRPQMTRKSVFISVANSEHAHLRDQLREVLAGEFDVIAQPSFPSSTVDVVRKLDREISKCDLLIHIVGQEPGTVAAVEAVKDYFDHVPRKGFLDRFPDASKKLDDCAALTYPQWEPWLALNQGKDVLVYTVAESMQFDFPQRDHLANLKLARRHAHVLNDLETAQSRNRRGCLQPLHSQRRFRFSVQHARVT